MSFSKGHSLDEDDAFSNISRISCGLRNSLNSTCNSDSECSGPISVRDMIHHYNSQTKQNEPININHKNTYKINAAKRHHHPSQLLLAATKSSYCGLNNYGSNINCHQLDDDNHNHAANTCCKNCTVCSCCRNRSHKNSTTTKMLSSTSSSFLLLQPNENNQKPNNNFNSLNSKKNSCTRRFSTDYNKINAKDTTHILAVENCSNVSDNNAAAAGAGADINIDTTTSNTNNSNILNDFGTELSEDCCSSGLFKKNHLLSTDTAEEASVCQQQPFAETTYQSKTTIAKTSSGVRIIVDIFFDQERCANARDIVGSRIETDIPQSRILAEFQQQTMAAECDTTHKSKSCQQGF